MLREELAALLDGRQYRDEITPELERAAAESGLVVVFGVSDDLMRFRGAVSDEVGAHDGGVARFTPAGLFDEDACDCECAYFRAARDAAVAVRALWDSGGYSWRYETVLPHASFDVLEGDRKYCRGIVFYLSHVRQYQHLPARRPDAPPAEGER